MPPCGAKLPGACFIVFALALYSARTADRKRSGGHLHVMHPAEAHCHLHCVRAQQSMLHLAVSHVAHYGELFLRCFVLSQVLTSVRG